MLQTQTVDPLWEELEPGDELEASGHQWKKVGATEVECVTEGCQDRGEHIDVNGDRFHTIIKLSAS